MGEFTINAKQLVLDWMGSNAFTPVNKAAAKKIGYKEAGLLGEAVNQYKRWHAEGKLDQNGWFFWTEDDCWEETTFPPSTQKALFKKLEEKGCLKRHKKRPNPDSVKTTRFIELKFTAIAEVMLEPEGAKEQRREERKERRQKQKEYKKSYDHKNGGTLGGVGKVENEPSGKVENEPSRKDQNEPSSKVENELLIKKDLELRNHELKKKLLKNQSISKIEQINIPTAIKEFLKTIDGLTDHKLESIEFIFKTNEITELAYIRVLDRVLNAQVKKAFKPYLQRAVEKELKPDPQKPAGSLPDFLDPAKKEVAAAADPLTPEKEEENRKWLEQLLGTDMK